MKRIKRILTLLLALATVLSLAACGTQKDEPAAGDDGAAAEEKKLVIYSAATDAQVNAVVPLFEERYGIEVEVITGGTGELLARIDAEGDAPYCDVIFGGGESSYSEYKHVFQDYVSPEDANLIESCRNTLGYCTNYNLDSAILMYNTDLIGDIQIKGYKDLLNPELKGKIASADPTASSSAMMHIETILTDFGGLTLENEEGWNFVSDLIKNLDGKLASGSSAAWKSVADGEMTVVLTYEEAGISLARSGANVAIVYPEEGTVLTPGTVGLIKNCSHPENGKLFIDFVTSAECQTAQNADWARRPVRSDIAPKGLCSLDECHVGNYDFSYAASNRDAIKEQFRPQSEKQLKLRLALEKIAELENLEVSDEAVEEEYEKLAKQYNMEVAQIKNLVAETQIRADLKNQKAIDFVKENASVKAEKPAKKTTRRKSTKKAVEEKTEETAEAKTEE